MRLQDILKQQRLKKKFTQEDISTKLFVTTQAVSKWENGKSIPSIDNLIMLSDLYNISLDELVSGSPFFKKPLTIGEKINAKKVVLFSFSWLFISLIFTGFGYQPFWIFLFILFLGTVIIFPTVFSNYWVIEQNGFKKKRIHQRIVKKLKN